MIFYKGETDMKNVITTEVKSGVCNLRFLLGVFLIVLVALVSEGAMLKKIADMGGSPEGPGWSVAYTYCTNSINTFLFIPIAVAFSAGENAQEELRTRFSMFSYIRTGKKKYLLGKAAGLLISGGFMICLAMGILLAVSVIGFGRYPSLERAGVDTARLYAEAAVSFPRLFLNGAFWALVGGMAAVVTKNRYMAYAVPFILYYVLTVFQERYYQELFFLSPRYWASPIYYGNLFCIGVLFTGTLLMAFLFMWAIKRRLEHA